MLPFKKIIGCLQLSSLDAQQLDIGLIQAKDEGQTGYSKDWQGCSKGFPKGKGRGKSLGAALPAQGKPHPSRLFYSDLQ